MTYRRRKLIPVIRRADETLIAQLTWNGAAMEVHTADGEFVGAYPTRKEATSALRAFLQKRSPQLLRGGWTTLTLAERARRQDVAEQLREFEKKVGYKTKYKPSRVWVP
jgi:hypothetical protein